MHASYSFDKANMLIETDSVLVSMYQTRHVFVFGIYKYVHTFENLLAMPQNFVEDDDIGESRELPDNRIGTGTTGITRYYSPIFISPNRRAYVHQRSRSCRYSYLSK